MPRPLLLPVAPPLQFTLLGIFSGAGGGGAFQPPTVSVDRGSRIDMINILCSPPAVGVVYFCISSIALFVFGMCFDNLSLKVGNCSGCVGPWGAGGG